MNGKTCRRFKTLLALKLMGGDAMTTEWKGEDWEAHWKFRGRPRQPKMKKMKKVKVKVLCYFSGSGIRYDLLENGEQHLSIKDDLNWTRVPSEDKEIEVPE